MYLCTYLVTPLPLYGPPVQCLQGPMLGCGPSTASVVIIIGWLRAVVAKKKSPMMALGEEEDLPCQCALGTLCTCVMGFSICVGV